MFLVRRCVVVRCCCFSVSVGTGWSLKRPVSVSCSRRVGAASLCFQSDAKDPHDVCLVCNSWMKPACLQRPELWLLYGLFLVICLWHIYIFLGRYIIHICRAPVCESCLSLALLPVFCGWSIQEMRIGSDWNWSPGRWNGERIKKHRQKIETHHGTVTHSKGQWARDMAWRHGERENEGGGAEQLLCSGCGRLFLSLVLLFPSFSPLSW